MSREIAIVGGGPIGLEAALYAEALGHRPRVYERGEVAGNVKDWGFVELFSPWKLNVSPLGLEVLRGTGVEPAAPEESLRGSEYRERYLLPIAAHLGERVRENCEVLGVTRQGMMKDEAIGSPERAERPFRLLLRPTDGREEGVRADVVIDASGVYQNRGALGDGGIPAPGETEARELIDYHLRDVTGRDRQLFAGRRTLLVGSGYSAATALVDLVEIGAQTPGTEIMWIRRQPLPRFENDPLPRRDRLARVANALAGSPPAGLEVLEGWTVERLERRPDGLCATLAGPDGDQREERAIGRILGLVGYRPDLALGRELQIHLCYATEGPMKLAALLLANDSGGDCLEQGGHGADSLANPEAGFFVLGHKSYGRRSDFLIKSGREQIRDVFRLIEGDPHLDLYREASET
ncbi:MAG: hypothetical protein O7J95_08430 [Planctomycetota bacterium]|nr:hypothetical protein [Planctomycetota bacterium]